MLRADLKTAGIPYCDETGRVADFHSFRVTYATMLLRSGVDLRTAKELMRHATVNMTADVYACTLRGSLNDAVKRLRPVHATERTAPRDRHRKRRSSLGASVRPTGQHRPTQSNAS